MKIDWDKLGFSYIQTNSHIQYTWRNGKWDTGKLVREPYLNLHVAATALHYGQSAFEGLKAFCCKDETVRLFRPDENAKRLCTTASRICMAEVPEILFTEAVNRVIQDNKEFVPPYGTGGSLYVRPLLFGSGPQIGVNPAEEYTFIVMVLPVGPYYKGGLKPVRAIVLENYDRAAPQGVGNVKVAGNYAASMKPHIRAKEAGFPIELYLDSREHKYIDEFGTSNFIGIKDGETYVTPTSSSILPSITNKSLQQLAKDLGMTVETRPIEFEEISSFTEVGACGTAVVVTPISEIIRGDRILKTGPRDSCGPVLQKLYSQMTAIQYGEAKDPYGWTVPVC